MRTRTKRILCLLLAVWLLFGNASLSAYAGGVHLSKTKATLAISQGVTLKLLDAKNKRIVKGVTWSSSDKTVAAVSEAGRVKTKKAGKATVYAKYKGRRYRCAVTVRNAVSVDRKALTFKAGQTKKTVTVTCKEESAVYCEVEQGADLVSCTWSEKWKGNQIKLTVRRTALTASGSARIRVYSEKHKKNSAVIRIKLISPCKLKVVNELPCTLTNYESKTLLNPDGVTNKVKVLKTAVAVNADGVMEITVDFKTLYSRHSEADYYYIYYKIKKDGYVTDSAYIISDRLAVGDRAKEKIRIYNAEKGTYSLEFCDHIAD